MATSLSTTFGYMRSSRLIVSCIEVGACNHYIRDEAVDLMVRTGSTDFHYPLRRSLKIGLRLASSETSITACVAALVGDSKYSFLLSSETVPKGSLIQSLSG